jgi:D-alanyl-D-alanine endopeptidase (penicillin-binding protein 7)
MTFFKTTLKALQRTAQRAVTVFVCALFALSLTLSPAQTEAKPVKKNQVTKKAQGKQIVKASSKRGGKPAANLKKGKAFADKGMKAAFANQKGNPKNKLKGKQKFKRVVYFAPAPPSVGVMSGLHATPDPLSLKSSVALVVDADSSQVLFEKNATTALPIASITKLMTALVVVDSRQDLNEYLTISDEDVQLEQRVRSRLTLGTQMTRRDALLLALMSSENRAANMLSRYYPGGKQSFVDAMNRKAAQLSMRQSYFVEGTGLASANVASAYDLVKLVKAAKQYPLLRELSTQSNFTFIDTSGKSTNFHTTNRLIANPNWEIALQKTGFINAAGQCLVMSTQIDGRSVVMIFLDSAGKLSRLGDAQRVRDWLATNPMATIQPAKLVPSPQGVSSKTVSPPTALASKPAGQVSTHAQQMIAWSPK